MIFWTLIFALLGVTLLIGGVWLGMLGGSWYYAVAGIALLVIAATTLPRRQVARLVYALLLVATAVWAYAEAGFDWWPLASRLGLLLLLAIPLLFPGPPASRGGTAVLAVCWVGVGLFSVASIAYDKHRIEGSLPEERVVDNARTGEVPEDEWLSYGRSNLGQRYSPLEQITPRNVSELELAWEYQTGDRKQPHDVLETTYQATPLKINDSLYLCTPHNWAIALNATTGEQQWVYDAKVGPEPQRQHQTCRGLSYLPPEHGRAPSTEVMQAPAETLSAVTCDAQLFLPTSDARLLALDPATGARCENFADGGELDLLHNMPFPRSGFYYSTSPPVVANGLVIVAGAVNDNYHIESPSGVIRAYNAKTGELVWNWDPANPGQTSPIAEGETYSASTPNSWSVASADEELGLIYFPMANSTPDQLGMYRSEQEERFASSVVALRIDTGELEWVQQFVHHDLWDMDTPAQPSLIDLRTDSGLQPALVVPTKQGDVYVLNRANGEPIIPIEELPAPQGTIEGDYAAPTQPVSGLTFRPPELTGADMWGATPVDQMLCRIKFQSLRYEGQYTPPSLQGTVVYPGNFGVFNWGGIAVDPERQVMFGMPLYMAFTSRLVDKAEAPDSRASNQGEQGLNENEGAPYAIELNPLMSPLGIPCQRPPWGYVAGVDLQTGEIVWQHKNGTIRDMSPVPVPLELGVPGIGGPVITRGGVVFLAATVDNYLRAYNLTNGEELWRGRLPAGGQATPMTYLNRNGEQMVVQVAGGHGSIGTTIGDYVVAFKLK